MRSSDDSMNMIIFCQWKKFNTFIKKKYCKKKFKKFYRDDGIFQSFMYNKIQSFFLIKDGQVRIMKYKQIKPKKIYEEVAEAIHEMIRIGQIKPGDKLESVQQLAENFQVGRSAIREALSALRAMGLVEMKQGEGTFVKGFEANKIVFPLSTAILMNKEDVRHLLEVRTIIEAGTAALAAENRTNEDIESMFKVLEEMKQTIGNGELGEKTDYKFHLEIAAASHNPMLAKLLEQVSDLMIATQRETRRLWLFSKQTTSEKLYQEHLDIFNAIVVQDGEKSRKAMLTHLDNVEKILEKYFEENMKEI